MYDKHFQKRMNLREKPNPSAMAEIKRGNPESFIHERSVPEIRVNDFKLFSLEVMFNGYPLNTFLTQKIKKSLLLILICFLSFPLPAEENFYFKRFTTENGLAQNTVYCILQDIQGFMWFGTKDGLCRFDGNQFKIFRNDKTPNCIGNSFIRSLYQEKEGLIWVGTDRGVYIYDPLTESFTPFVTQTEGDITIEREVNDIKQDKEGNLWFAVDWQGVFCYDKNKEKLLFYDLHTIVNAWSIYIDSENNVWIGTHGGGLNYLNREANKFEPVRYSLKNDALGDIYRLYENSYNSILIGTARGVRRFDLVTNRFTNFRSIEEDNVVFIRDILRRSENEIWFGTESGLYIYHEKNNTIKHLTHNYTDNLSLSDNAVYCMYKDREGGIWVGTYFGGINYYPPQYTPFEKFYPVGTHSLRGKRVREIHQDKNNRLWIGTEDEGLNIFDPAKHTFTHLYSNSTSPSLSSYNIHGMMVDGDKIWVSTLGHGIDIIDINTYKVIKHYEKNSNPNSLCDNSVFSIYKDKAGTIWIGTLYGLCIYEPDTDSFRKIEFTGNSFIQDILQTSDGNIWIAALGKGLYQYNPRSHGWRIYDNDPANPYSLPYNKIITLFEDSNHTLWIGTEGAGLCKYDAATSAFITYTTQDGLPNNIIYKILEDDAHKLWFTTNQGLVCMNPQNNNLKVYTKSNGLLSDQFNYNSGFKDAGGKLYFGNQEGLIAFDPKNFEENPYVPPVYITNFMLFNQLLKPSDENSLLHQSTTFGGKIDLPHDLSTFSFDFAALSYSAAEKNSYAYILEGFDTGWNFASRYQQAYYSNIPPGKYTFKVKASNQDNIWNKQMAEMTLVIHPPFYKTTGAYLCYFIIGIGILAFIIYRLRKRNQIRAKRKQEIFENEKEKELYNAKIAFFTTIAHEIRTPLSLIKGPLEYIMKESVTEKEQKEHLEIINKNTTRLHDLTNQFLDFRKTEKEGFKLNFVKTDVSQLLSETYERFRLTAEQKQINFTLKLPAQTIFADIDREAVTKIISNLFNNALKYAHSTISVIAEEDTGNNSLTIQIANDGYIIPEEYAETIFEPFYQIKDTQTNTIPSGTGLGLSLARSLATLHNGSLFLEKYNPEFNRFNLTLPLHHEKIAKTDVEEIPGAEISTGTDSPVEDIQTEEDENTSSGNRLTILLVEDDAEMQLFLRNILKNQYHIKTAGNGQEALAILNETQVDLIISDILMPVMDGLQLCEKIKNRLSYSHIPIILLTAKTGIGANIEGLDAGADAYIEKPFSTEYLKAQITNLFSNREKLKASFTHSPFSKAGTMASSKADEEFLQKATDIIHKYLSDENFTIDLLAEELNMSRSSLHRKIKGISELTPNDFILLVKLKKAAEYLSNKTYRVNEVCYVVGFTSSSYFSKCFKKYFGLSPREFIKKEEGN